MKMRAIGALCVAGVFLAACGGTGTGYQYLTEKELGAFLKVPVEWETFAEEDVLHKVVPDRSADDVATIAERSWTTAFDSAPTPDLDHVLGPTATHPWGFVQVRPLQGAERDNVSLASLRSQFVPDPLSTQAEENVEVLTYAEVNDADVWGVRFVITVSTTGGRTTLAQTALVDAARSRLYVFLVGCEKACFEEHRDAIEEVVASWTVKPR